mmetsp:Transcript_54928/g.117881  ORF Transcript_54928/g.117881 Transcript_54928/m.117881 type:complete len:80 (-) Transcript_54928:63-302(-)
MFGVLFGVVSLAVVVETTVGFLLNVLVRLCRLRLIHAFTTCEEQVVALFMVATADTCWRCLWWQVVFHVVADVNSSVVP